MANSTWAGSLCIPKASFSELEASVNRTGSMLAIERSRTKKVRREPDEHDGPKLPEKVATRLKKRNIDTSQWDS